MCAYISEHMIRGALSVVPHVWLAVGLISARREVRGGYIARESGMPENRRTYRKTAGHLNDNCKTIFGREINT